MNKCDHEYWSPYPDLMLCHKCNDSYSKSKRYGVYEPLLVNPYKPEHDNIVIRVFFDDDNKPAFKF